MPTAVVTDSTSDIPADLAQRYAIQIVPNIMIIAGQEYEDGKGLSARSFIDGFQPSIPHPPPQLHPAALITYFIKTF